MNETGVGLVGYKSIGRTHSNIYRQIARFFDVHPLWDGYAPLGAAECCLASLWEGLSQQLPGAERPTPYGNEGSGVVR